MKSIFIIVFVLTSLWSFSQTESGQVIKQDSCIYVIENMPIFPGGNIQKWIAKNVKYPVLAIENGIQGKVYIQFVIEKDGAITDVKVIRGVDASLDKEAVRLVQSMPKWQPAKQKGKKIRKSYVLPVGFHLPN